MEHIVKKTEYTHTHKETEVPPPHFWMGCNEAAVEGNPWLGRKEQLAHRWDDAVF